MDNEVKYEVAHTTVVTAIVVNYRTPDLAIRCLNTLRRADTTGFTLNVVVVDGASGDDSVEKLESFVNDGAHQTWITIVPLGFNGGFGWANNHAIRLALTRKRPADYVYLVNPDAMVNESSLIELVEALRTTAAAGAAGSLLIDDSGASLGSKFRFPSVRSELVRGSNTSVIDKMLFHSGSIDFLGAYERCDWVTGASVLLRSSTLKETGLFDEGFFLYFEEVELMYRISLSNWCVIHVPTSIVEHVGGAATGVLNGAQRQGRLPPYWFRSRRRFFTLAYGRWHSLLATCAWLAGRLLWAIRTFLGMGRHGTHARLEAFDLVCNGMLFISSDNEKAVPAWDSRASEVPAWVKYNK